MVYLENSESKISQEFSEILPPSNKKHVGATLKPEQFTDLCLSKPVADYIDCFNRRAFYDQNVSRYFNLSLSEMSYLNLPDAVQKTIRESLQSMGQNENDQKVDSYALLLEQAQPGAESCDNFLNAEGLRNLDEAELCKKFGIEPE